MHWFFLYDVKALLNKKTIIIVILLISLCFMAGIIIGTSEKEDSSSGNRIAIGLLDEDQSKYSNMILSFLNSGAFDSYVNVFYKEDEDSLKELINENSIDLYIVIPDDFVQNVIRIENTPVRVVINYTDVSKAVFIKNLLETYEKYIESVQISCVTLYHIMEKDAITETVIDTANIEISLELVAAVLDKDSFFNRILLDDITNVPLLKYYGYELIFLIIVYISMVYGVRMMKEHQAGIISRIMSSGLSPACYIIGKQLIMQFIFAVIFIFIYIMRYINEGIFYYKSCLFCILTAMIFLAMFSAAGSLFNSIKSYLLAFNILIIFSILLGGGIIPVLYLPKLMADIARYMPNFLFIKMMHDYSINNENADIIRYALLCGVILLLTTLISCSVYAKREGVPADV